MSKRAIGWSFACLALILSLFVLQAGAQADFELKSLEVDLWPEYDRKAVLVIYRVVLPADVSLPVDLTFRIPAAAGEPSAVAVRQVSSAGQSGLFTIPHTRQVSSEWGLINMTATMPELQIEYYDPGLQMDGPDRQFEYRWPGDYAVETFSIQVQQPVGAADMQISPSAGAGKAGEDGLTYYNKPLGALPVGQTFSLSFRYQKADDSLSVSNFDVQPNAPIVAPETTVNFRTLLPWMLGLLGVALIVGGGIWYWQSGKSKSSGESRRGRRSAGPREESRPSDGANVYCHQCGNRAAPGDRFCRTCGTKLRLG
jgi:hypothetical protein